MLKLVYDLVKVISDDSFAKKDALLVQCVFPYLISYILRLVMTRLCSDRAMY